MNGIFKIENKTISGKVLLGRIGHQVKEVSALERQGRVRRLQIEVN